MQEHQLSTPAQQEDYTPEEKKERALIDALEAITDEQLADYETGKIELPNEDDLYLFARKIRDNLPEYSQKYNPDQESHRMYHLFSKFLHSYYIRKNVDLGNQHDIFSYDDSYDEEMAKKE